MDTDVASDVMKLSELVLTSAVVVAVVVVPVVTLVASVDDVISSRIFSGAHLMLNCPTEKVLNIYSNFTNKCDENMR